jgi:hypothetical protein
MVSDENQTLALTPALSHPMGEGESLAVYPANESAVFAGRASANLEKNASYSPTHEPTQRLGEDKDQSPSLSFPNLWVLPCLRFMGTRHVRANKEALPSDGRWLGVKAICVHAQ